jgi:hypothetical protein
MNKKFKFSQAFIHALEPAIIISILVILYEVEIFLTEKYKFKYSSDPTTDFILRKIVHILAILFVDIIAVYLIFVCFKKILY